MARSKTSHSRANNKTQPRAACHNKHGHCRCVQCITHRNRADKNGPTPASLGHRSPQDVRDAIEHQWKILSADMKHFLLANKAALNLRKLVDFWSDPRRVEQASGSCASGIGGASWYLALSYLSLGELFEAQALILNGGFMQECARSSIEEIVALCKDATKKMCDDGFDEKLAIYCDALRSTSTKQSMESYLHSVLPPEYRRRMSFACQAGKANGRRMAGDYVNFISDDWNEASSTSPAAARCPTKGANDATIEVVFETETRERIEMNIGVSNPFRSIFSNYAELRQVSLRSLRFTHAGKILFLSSAGSKTAEQLGIKHRDIIYVSAVSSSPNAAPGAFGATKKSPIKSPPKNRKKRSGKNRRRRPDEPPAADAANDSYEQDKIKHSTLLSLVFEEARPILKSIRQRINTTNMERTPPKQRSPGRTTSEAAAAPVRNPPATGVGGKAGTTRFSLRVGESENLYKTTKPSARSSPRRRRPIVADLHGLTKREALSKLDRELNRWKDVAMEGSYPFVVPVEIVCGGGGQVLSEVVENWVRENENVANFPKNHAA